MHPSRHFGDAGATGSGRRWPTLLCGLSPALAGAKVLDFSGVVFGLVFGFLLFVFFFLFVFFGCVQMKCLLVGNWIWQSDN